VLDQLGVEWAVGGSLASSIHGEPRSTNDIDIIAKLQPFHARRFARALGDDFYADELTVLEAIEANRSFNVIDQRTVIKSTCLFRRRARWAKDSSIGARRPNSTRIWSSSY